MQRRVTNIMSSIYTRDVSDLEVNINILTMHAHEAIAVATVGRILTLPCMDKVIMLGSYRSSCK